MDEQLKVMLESTLMQRFELAYAAMEQEHAEDAAPVKRLVELSQQIEHHTGITEDAQSVLREFLALNSESDLRFRKYLYIQGAKDCVAILRELGVIQP